MIGTIVVTLTVLIFFIFLIKHPRHFFRQLRRKSLGYCLLVEKYQKEDQYYLVFQQGDKEWTYLCTPNAYVKLQPPRRGELFLSQGVFDSFEE